MGPTIRIVQDSLDKHAKALIKAADSSDRYAKSLICATWVLAVATIVLVIATLYLAHSQSVNSLVFHSPIAAH